MTDDLISRQAVIDAIKHHQDAVLGEREYDEGVAYGYAAAHGHIIDVVNELPCAKIDYWFCADAMLMMWMNKVVTDGEYDRIMNRLNKERLHSR